MSVELKSLDIRFLVREVREALLGGVFRKVYQYGAGQNQFLFDVFAPGKGSFWLYADARGLFLAQHRPVSPQEPPAFCMLLRKRLTGRSIRDIRQVGFDRLVEIVTDDCILVLEFVPPGNVVLCDSSYNVIMPLHSKRWKDRSLLPKRPYVNPPSGINPYAISPETFGNIVRKSDGSIVSFLAKAGLGSVYANEVCLMTGVGPEKPAKGLSGSEVSAVFEAMKKLAARKPEPVSYEDGTVSPFPLRARAEPTKEWPSMSAALDGLFSVRAEKEAGDMQKKAMDEETGRLLRIVERQTWLGEQLNADRVGKRETADAIYSSYSLVDSILSGVRKAKDSGLSWADIKARLKQDATPEARAVVEIREHRGVVVVNLGGKLVELDFRKSVEENAGKYYEGSKAARKKHEGAEAAMAEKKEQLRALELIPEPQHRPAVIKKAAAGKQYDGFRTFTSSDGFLIVAGKDAETNESLIKKHAKAGDLVFHTDIQGSSFAVIKAGKEGGSRFSDETRKEASQITAVFSKAWSRGLASVDVYAVRPDQLSKKPPSGMSMAKGSFMIYGKREWFRDVDVRIAIGVLVDKDRLVAEAVSGPVSLVKSRTKCFVILQPGDSPAPKLAPQIRDRLARMAKADERPLIKKMPLEQIQRLIPSGTGQIAG